MFLSEKMLYGEKEELSRFDGNAQRNLRKLVRSGLIQPVIKYCRNLSSGKKSKPLKLSIHSGNTSDAIVLYESVAAQQWRKRLAKENQVPKGHTKSPKLGASNMAFAKGLAAIEPATYFSHDKNSITILPEGATLIVEAVQDYRDQLPELNDLF